MAFSTIPQRSNLILNFFLAGLLLIVIRVWYLSVVKQDYYLEESQKPKRKAVVERIERGTIRDRFNLPLAVNQIQYNAAIRYSDIRQIPSITWQKDAKGKRKRIFARKEYIEKLSLYLGEQLDMDPEDIADTIHGKACLFPHTPFVLKEDISEELFLKLKMSEKDWLGIDMQRSTKRFYPQGKTACDVVGYVGAISEKEYHAIADEMKALATYLEEHGAKAPVLLPKGLSSPEEARARLEELQKRAYTINDQVGKTGVEAAYDEALRGKVGRSIYEMDNRGNLLGKLPSSEPATSGDRVILSLSVELQEEAERLLTEYENFQDKRDAQKPSERRHPWQRGGAIVAMHPKTGEILAMASYPRFDPNDLVPAQSYEKRREKSGAIQKWLESESYIGSIWDGKRPLERERFAKGSYFNEEIPLTWEVYLDAILAKETDVYCALSKIETIQQAFEADLSSIENERDRDLFSDLLDMVVPKDLFPSQLLEAIGDQTLSDLRLCTQVAATHLDSIKELARNLFHERNFRAWRKENFTGFLKEKRRIERAKKRYARPYTEYLEKEERAQFESFWKENSRKFLHAYLMGIGNCPYLEEILALRKQTDDPHLEHLQKLLSFLSPQNQFTYLHALRTFDELDRPLRRNYPPLRSKNGTQLEKHLACGFYPYCGFGYGRSNAFRQATPLGSIFKIVTGYAGLKQQYEKNAPDLNPLTIVDDMQWIAKSGSNQQVLGFYADGTPIKRLHNGGRLPRAYPKIGKLNVSDALERTSNIYFSLLASEMLDSPTQLVRSAIDFGFGSKTGIDLPFEYAGNLPDDILHNKTGLYAFAIGQHSLIATPLQTAVMLSAIANGGQILKPQVAKLTAGREKVTLFEPTIRDDLHIPPEVQEPILEGMRKVTSGEKGTARLELIRSAFHDPEAYQTYKKIHSQMAGKTGTVEIMYKQTLDAESPAILEKHIGFGAIAYNEEEPELIVIVYNRFGTAGKQGAPIAAQMIKRWREIQDYHYNAQK